MKNKQESLGDRMKNYESVNRQYLIPRLPTVIRLDGKAFGTFTKQFDKPFDDKFISIMNETAKYLCSKIQGAVFAYVQSDEISIYISESDNVNSKLWYDGNIQKIASVSASLAASKFNNLLMISKLNSCIKLDETTKINLCEYKETITHINLADFDSRVFQLPNNTELINSFIWRQQDCIRNSVATVAQCNFSQKELNKKSVNDMKEMLRLIDKDWDKLDDSYKQGRFITKTMFINDIRVGDGENDVWYQPDYTNGLYPNKYGRALLYSELSEEDKKITQCTHDWCDIEIKKIRTKWNASSAFDFLLENHKFKL